MPLVLFLALNYFVSDPSPETGISIFNMSMPSSPTIGDHDLPGAHAPEPPNSKKAKKKKHSRKGPQSRSDDCVDGERDKYFCSDNLIIFQVCIIPRGFGLVANLDPFRLGTRASRSS